jgi:hypothetical protein
MLGVNTIDIDTYTKYHDISIRQNRTKLAMGRLLLVEFWLRESHWKREFGLTQM